MISPRGPFRPRDAPRSQLCRIIELVEVYPLTYLVAVGLMTILVVIILTRHQRRMAEIQKEREATVTAADLLAVRTELHELRLTMLMQTRAIEGAVRALRVPGEETFR